MKRIIAFVALAFLLPLISQAQVPQAISYQAVARDGSGNPMANKSIGVRITIKDGSSSGATVYQETEPGVTTNQFGLFTIQVGNGTSTFGTFSSVDWGTNTKYIQVEFDPNGGTSYLDMGTTQLLSVPYALFAAKTSGGDKDSLIVNGNQLTIVGGNTVLLPSGSGGGDNWGTQTAVTNSTISGNGTFASPLGLASQTASNGQVLKWNGVSWAPAADNNTTYTGGTGISVSGTTVTNTAPDQTVVLNGTGGTTVTGTYPTFTINSTGTNYVGGTGISISGNTITNTAPNQAVTIAGGGGTTVTGTYPNFTVSSTGSTYTGGSGITVSGTTITNNAVTDNATITGNGTTTTPLKLASQGASSGQVLKWNGTSWAPAADNGAAYTAGTGINISGGNVISNTIAQVNLTGSGGTTVTGTYPNLVVNSTAPTTYTGGTGISVSGSTITNTAPDQPVTITGTGAATVTGTYPNFTVNATNTTYTAGSGLSLTGTAFSLAQQGATSGQVLQWNGTSWAPTTPASGGGGTLNDAYNFGGAGAGRIITANTGAVEVNTTTVSQAALKATTTANGVAILASSSLTNAGFSTIQSTISSSDTTTAAVLGHTTSGAYGVAGQVDASATAHAAIWGNNLRTTGGEGVFGLGFSGMLGQAKNVAGSGVYGTNLQGSLGSQPNNLAPGITGLGFAGVLGQTITNDGFGVFGVNFGPTKTGLYDNAGVQGQGFIGVEGVTNTAGVGYGVLSGGDIGGTADLYVNGNIDCGGFKLFLIDHPFDPANKFLRHFCIESNEVLNIYRGTIQLDANGEAVVQLPDYIQAINKSFTYQLTAIGQPAPSLYIKTEMGNNQFVIAGGAPNQKVSWHLTGERNDVYTASHPEQREVEVAKKPHQVGKYMHPLEYGHPLSDGIIYVHNKLLEKSATPGVEQSTNSLIIKK